MKKILALTLTLVLFAATASAATLSEAGTFPVVLGEPEKLTILIAEDTLVTDFEDNAFTRYVEENCNVELDFVLLPASDAASKLQLMISSGEKLPDVICFALDNSTAYSYAKAGAIIPLDEYYQNTSVNFKRAVETYPEDEILEQIVCSDGHIYSIPRYIPEIHNDHQFRYWINTAWLEAVDMEMPTTTEAFYEALKAFKEGDPNGNGIQDEIPLLGAWQSDVSTYNLTVFLMNSFVYTSPPMKYLYLEDGQVRAAYATEGWREGLAYMNRLSEEGLIDAASFTQTTSQSLATLSNPDDCIVGCYALQGSKAPYIEQFTALMPLEGPTGLRQAAYTPAGARNRWMVTSDCENPELAYRVGDFMFTDEAFLLCRIGEKGVSWVPATENDVSVFGPEYPVTHIKLDNDAMWVNAQNSTWRQAAPVFAEIGLNGEAAHDDHTEMEAKNIQAALDLSRYVPADDTWIYYLSYTEDEEFSINDIAASLKTYALESMVRFITGDMDIDTEWDAYLTELEKIGLSTYLEVSQNAYMRR